jgi:hypothetical protein
MNYRALLPVFAATLFTSAFLIFAVQPMASKMLLPLLGGSPSVWNTAMVFFQAMLLAGYGYAHFVAKVLPLRLQGILHLALLLFFTFVLPLSLPPGIQPPEEGGQALWQLGIMLTCIGGPFFVLAASAPLFQHWFSASGHEDAANPYHLYAVSNIGSMISLLSYPVIIEPFLGLHEQTITWAFGYGLLILLTASCAWLVRSGAKPVPPLSTAEDRLGVSWLQRLVWISLSFIPSSLMLGVTTMITTDLASAPFLWIVPLTIYLVTFIIAFSKKPFISVPVARELAVYSIALIILAFMLSGFMTIKIPMVIIHMLAFFICAQLCHGELALARPSTSHLTEYFLLISFGGVLGGIFNALIAPTVFLMPMEYSITLATIGFVVWAGTSTLPRITGTFNALEDKKLGNKLLSLDLLIVGLGLGVFIIVYMVKDNITQMVGTIFVFVFLLMMGQNRFVFAMTACAALLIFQPSTWSMDKKLIDLDRNYFGVIKVYEQRGIHFFYHGTTLHGAQYQREDWKYNPVTYYSPGGPASDVFNELSRNGVNQNVSVLGLGVGSVACYKKAGRHFDFYEIDADVVRVAENPKYFSYLSGCGSDYDVILGDGRLKIEEAPDGKYGMIFLDAFSSDNIPVHVMTQEAFQTYLNKLADGGFIAMNISNRYLDLRPVLTAIGKELGMTVYFKIYRPEKIRGEVSELYTESVFAVMAKDPGTLANFVENHDWKPYHKPVTMRPWTDDYANILGSLIALQ